MLLAPIVLFVYNRPAHTRYAVEALQKNNLALASDIFIYSDGPRKNSDIDKVHEVRKYLKSITGFKTVKIIAREENYGLAKSIISGVTEIVNKYGKVIVLEDDLVTSPYFLQYMNEALDLYQNEERVISIHGYIYPVTTALPETFFLKGADCWGWGTWKRGWDLFEPDGQKLLDELKEKNLTKEFDFNNSYPYTQMLKDQIKGKNDSWAIRWYASAFLRDKLTLYPGVSLVQNIGLDGSGVHCGKYNRNFFTQVIHKPIQLSRIVVIEDKEAKEKLVRYFRSLHLNLFSKLTYYCKRLCQLKLKK